MKAKVRAQYSILAMKLLVALHRYHACSHSTVAGACLLTHKLQSL